MTTDNIIPEGKWEFDSSVTDVFDDMLARSIPQYEVMRQAVTRLAAIYAQRNTDIVDIGCARGEAMSPLVDKFGCYNRFVGLETSQPMIAAARERFAGMINAGIVQIKEHDLRTPFPPLRASVVLSVLTIQFTPIEYRQRIIADIYDCLIPGGAFILVEKVLGTNAELTGDFVSIYHEMKGANGYSQDQIERKRLALEGVLVPVTADWNEQLLRSAGFRVIDSFWRWMNFAGWIAIKR